MRENVKAGDVQPENGEPVLDDVVKARIFGIREECIGPISA